MRVVHSIFSSYDFDIFNLMCKILNSNWAKRIRQANTALVTWNQDYYEQRQAKINLFYWRFRCETNLSLVLLNPDILCFANSVDPDQLASEEANWSGSALFAIKYVNF